MGLSYGQSTIMHKHKKGSPVGSVFDETEDYNLILVPPKGDPNEAKLYSDMLRGGGTISDCLVVICLWGDSE
jgi:hypothetical protein